jgi:hypothetical protein
MDPVLDDTVGLFKEEELTMETAVDKLSKLEPEEFVFPEAFDQSHGQCSIGSLLWRGDAWIGMMKLCKLDADSNPVVMSNMNPSLDACEYEIELPYGTVMCHWQMLSQRRFICRWMSMVGLMQFPWKHRSS